MTKRINRSISPELRQKISQGLKNAYQSKPMSDEHKKRISQSMKQYWSTIPCVSSENNEEEKRKEATNA